MLIHISLIMVYWEICMKRVYARDREKLENLSIIVERKMHCDPFRIFL